MTEAQIVARLDELDECIREHERERDLALARVMEKEIAARKKAKGKRGPGKSGSPIPTSSGTPASSSQRPSTASPLLGEPSKRLRTSPASQSAPARSHNPPTVLVLDREGVQWIEDEEKRKTDKDEEKEETDEDVAQTAQGLETCRAVKLEKAAAKVERRQFGKADSAQVIIARLKRLIAQGLDSDDSSSSVTTSDGSSPDGSETEDEDSPRLRTPETMIVFEEA